MSSPSDPLITLALAEALGLPVGDVLSLPDYVRVFCFELLTFGGPQAGQ